MLCHTLQHSFSTYLLEDGYGIRALQELLGRKDVKTAMKNVYIETSIPSYLTARPSRDVRAAAWRELTVQWLDTARSHYDLYTSETVVAEARE